MLAFLLLNLFSVLYLEQVIQYSANTSFMPTMGQVLLQTFGDFIMNKTI